MSNLIETATRAWSSRNGRRWLASWAVAVLCCCSAVGLYQSRYPTVSPIDEFHHIDYAMQLADGHLVGRGDRFGQPMMREFVCRGLDESDTEFPLPPCTVRPSALDPAAFPERGYNSAYIHPPTYYAVAAVGGTIARWFDRSFVAGARLVNMLWVVAFVTAMGLVFWMLDRSRSLFVAASVVCVVNPASLHAMATVNPDAAALAAGAGTLLGYLGWTRSHRWGWLVLVIAPVAVKSTHGLASVAALGLLVLGAWSSERRTEQRWARAEPAVIVAGGIGAVSAVVLLVQRALVTAPESVIDQLRRFRVDQLPVDHIAGNLLLVPPIHEYAPLALRTTAVMLTAILITMGLLGATVVCLASVGGSVADGQLRRIGAAALLTMLMAGPGLVVFNYVRSSIYVDIPPRYLMSLVPWLTVAAVGVGDRWRSLRWAWLALGIVTWVVLMWTMFGASTLAASGS